MRKGVRAIFLPAFALAVAAIPLIAAAQPVNRMPRIGVVIFTPALKEGLLHGLREAGYTEGRNIVLEQRIGERSAVPLSKQIEELLGLKVDVIVATGVSVAVAKTATSKVPIVAVDLQHDPVASGFAVAYSRPEGNLTGLFLDMPELAAKHLELLREAVPGLSRVAVLWDDRFGGPHFRALEKAARSVSVTVVSVPVQREADLSQALDRMVAERPQAVIGLGSAVVSRNRKEIADAALKHRLPAISLYTNFPEVGGLAGYGPDYAAMFRRAATYVDRILKGAKPGELPIERPSKYELVINLNTAKALGISIPPAWRVRADQVIE